MLEIADRGEARAEIVQRDARAHSLELADRAPGRLDIAQQCGFGNFNDQTV